jgi:hypothetical protein
MSASQHTRELGGGPIFGAAHHTIHNSIAERALVSAAAEKERPELPAIRGSCSEKHDADRRSVGGEGGGGSALLLTSADELVKQAISGPHTRTPSTSSTIDSNLNGTPYGGGVGGAHAATPTGAKDETPKGARGETPNGGGDTQRRARGLLGYQAADDSVHADEREIHRASERIKGIESLT